jgi:sialate O-acetylesterase
MVLAITILTIGSCSLIGDRPAKNIKPAELFGDYMVLQQGCAVPVWGSADPGGMVTVTALDQKKEVIAGKDGRWMVKLDALKAGGPYELKVFGAETITYKNVLVGEVWLGSGQSNMEMPLAGWGEVMNFKDEIAAADFPNIRLYHVERSLAYTPQSQAKNSGWQICSPHSVAEFSATAFFFGRKLHQDLQVPVGIIHSSWGGTVIEAWISAGALKPLPEFEQPLQTINKKANNATPPEEAQRKFERELAAWQTDMDKRDAGYSENPRWYAENLDARQWKTMKLPELWESRELPDMDGVVWFRREIDLPASWAGKNLQLYAGKIDDVDTTWFNGEKIGSVSVWDQPRVYTIPGKLVKAGRNALTIRVLDTGGGGGIWGEPELLKIEVSKNELITLTGTWQYRVGVDWKTAPARPFNPNNPNQPTVLFNAMIHPVLPYALKGAIWYQGESNAGRAYQYRALFPMMIKDWRSRWGLGDFPFMFVQLANWLERDAEPGENNWAELREAQTMTLSLPNTGMAVAIDIGDAKDIHPKNKQEVGRRLALNALKIAYKKDIVGCGPIYKSMSVENNRIRLTFSNNDGGLKTSDGDAVRGFAVAGADRVWRWAKAEIQGGEILVSSPQIKNPVAARYAWAANPDCNLVNGSDLPASPFRTDDWPGVTINAR